MDIIQLREAFFPSYQLCNAPLVFNLDLVQAGPCLRGTHARLEDIP